jgi:hypothetical protein
MKRAFLFALLMLGITGVAFAAFGVQVDNTIYPAADQIKCTTAGGVGCSVANGQLTLTGSNAGVAALTSGTIAGTTINSSTVGATSASTVHATTLQVDTTIYDNGITAGAALCIASTGYLGHCTSTPTSGNCTCVAN